MNNQVNTWVGVRTWEEERARQLAISEKEVEEDKQKYSESRERLLSQLNNSDLFNNYDRQYYRHYVLDYSVMQNDDKLASSPMKGQNLIELIATNMSIRKHLGYIKPVMGQKTTSEGQVYQGLVRWSYWINDIPVFFSSDLDKFIKTVLSIADSQRFSQEFKG